MVSRLAASLFGDTVDVGLRQHDRAGIAMLSYPGRTRPDCVRTTQGSVKTTQDSVRTAQALVFRQNDPEVSRMDSGFTQEV